MRLDGVDVCSVRFAPDIQTGVVILLWHHHHPPSTPQTLLRLTPLVSSVFCENQWLKPGLKP